MLKMRNLFKTNLLLLIASFASLANGQQVDPSIIKNLSPSEVEMVMSEIDKSTPVSNPAPTVTESTVKSQTSDDINKIGGQKYGYSYFSSIPTSITAVGDLPLPNDYRISLKDQFTVIMSGSREAIFDLDVKLDGTILFPELGSISVVGETLEDVKQKLTNLVDQSYIGVQIDLSIKNLAAKKVTIVGAVKTPGTYLVNPFSTISSALAYSGGISDIGTLRKIRLIRNSGEIFFFDLYKLLISGDRSKDITVEAGDVIIIDPANQSIALRGEVVRPGVYEVIEGETLADLIYFGLGFTGTANLTNINANVLNLDLGIIQNALAVNLDMALTNVLSVNINSYVNKNVSNIEVGGSVKEPGLYSLEDYKTLEELIDGLEFVNVYPWLGVLEQFDENNLVQSSILFSLKDKSTYQSIKLLPNSKVYFANINQRSFSVSALSQNLINDYELTLNFGSTPYKLPVFGRFSVKSFLDLLGLDLEDVDEFATYISPLESKVINGNYKEMDFIAQKFNTVSFRTPINDLITVNVSGAVDYPGSYTLESSATLQDLYNLIGNFKPEAFIDGIVFKRETIRERQIESIEKSRADLTRSILTNTQRGINMGDVEVIRALSESINPDNLGRIAGDYSPMSDSASNTILLAGDSIVIPRNPNTINVLGEVLNPIAFNYQKGISVREAVQNAGGFQDYADKRKVYVIKANGLIERPSRSVFTDGINLEPGDTIVIPRKIFSSNPGISALLPITQVLSDLAFSSAALETLTDGAD